MKDDIQAVGALFSAMGAIILGLVVSPVCLTMCAAVKNALGYDDALDVFGIHGIGGIWGTTPNASVSETSSTNPVSVTVTDNASAGTNRYLRLRVTRP